jgi:hypothetical protein
MKAIRPVVWNHHRYPGFAGTCYCWTFLGHFFAVTARHVLGKRTVRPNAVRIPRDLNSLRMELLRPTNVYWYNAGDYDHVVDVAVLTFGEEIVGAIDTLDILSASPSPGDRLYVCGYPKSRSQIHYDVQDDVPEAMALLDPGSKSMMIAVWDPVIITATCNPYDRESAMISMTLDDVDGLDDIDGMSGSPVFSVGAAERLTLAGMLVRGSAAHRKGHFIDQQLVGQICAGVMAKNRAMADAAIDIAPHGTLKNAYAAAADMALIATGGNAAAAKKLILEWPSSGQSLATQILLGSKDTLMRDPDKLRERMTQESFDILRQSAYGGFEGTPVADDTEEKKDAARRARNARKRRRKSQR